MKRGLGVALAAAAIVWVSAVVFAQRLAFAVPRLGPANIDATPRPGDPLPGLTPADFSEFRLGLDDFLEVETAAEGLGPAFNGTSCAVCHNVPAVGGTSAILETRVGTRDGQGNFIPLDATGETLMHLFSVPTHGCQPLIPDTATIIARRAPIPVFAAQPNREATLARTLEASE